MSRQSTDDQLRFLLSCVRHSQSGKVDFGEVAKECSIVSKGAAAKRFERMMKANDINLNSGPTVPSLSSNPSTQKSPKKDTKANGKGTSAKKRKINETTSVNTAADDDDNDNDSLLKTKEKSKKANKNTTPTKSRSTSGDASAPDKQSLTPTPGADNSVNVSGNDVGLTSGMASGMYDGPCETVVEANPNWGYDNGRGDRDGLLLGDTNTFDAFIHADHPLNGPCSEFENNITMTLAANDEAGKYGECKRQVKLEDRSIFLD